MTDTKELLALALAATPGPWQPMNDRDWDVVIGDIDGPDDGEMHYAAVAEIIDGSPRSRANAALIVAAVNALPALCAEVEAWREFYFAQVERDAAATSREKDSRGLVVGYINPGYGKTVSERDAYEAENQRLKAASNDAFARENLAIYKLAIAGERCAELAAKEPK